MSAAKMAAVEAYESLAGCGVEAAMSVHNIAVAVPRPGGSGASSSGSGASGWPQPSMRGTEISPEDFFAPSHSRPLRKRHRRGLTVGGLF